MEIWTIPGKNHDSNVYIIVGEVPTIIDTGTGFYSQMIIKTIEKTVKLDQIRQILLTHEHYDHVGGVQDIVKATKGFGRICASKTVVSKLKEGKSTFAEMLGGTMPKIKVDVPLSDGDHIIIGDQSYEILLTPGHSLGSLCIYGKENEVLFSGDTIFANGGFGRYDFPGGDFNLLLHSIERLTRLQVTKLYPGHGPIIEKHGATHVAEALRSIRMLV